MITPYNVLRHELVGLMVRVVDATHEGYRCQGKIVGETRNTLKIVDNGTRKFPKGNFVALGLQSNFKKIKTLPKNCITLELNLPNNCVVRIDGNLLVARPEDRIKKKYRIKFM